MRKRRVKITGIGPVTPAGIGRENFWRGIVDPVSRVAPFGDIGEEFGPFVSAHIPEFDIGNYVKDRNSLPKGAARHTLFAVAGALLALRDASLQTEELRNSNCVIISGSSLMDFGGITRETDMVHRRGMRAANPRTVFNINLTSVPDAINHVLGFAARTMSIQNSCCSGMDAVGYAVDLVADGRAEIAICGGTEAPLHRHPLLQLRAAGLTPSSIEMADRMARPFDLWRTTGVVSEGSTMFVVEPESSPRPGYSFISGYGFSNDEMGDLCSGMLNAGKLALAAAGVRPSQVEALSAWGPGHKLIDKAEADMMNRLFGKKVLENIPVVSIKGAIGSPLGAAPAIQIAAGALAQRYSLIPPTVNWVYPDPECPFNLSNRPRAVEHSLTLVNAHGVGCVNSSMVLERC